MSRKKNRESWLVFYRTDGGDLTSEEYPTTEYTKEQAIQKCGDNGTVELINDVPLVKRLVYVRAKKTRVADGM